MLGENVKFLIAATIVSGLQAATFFPRFEPCTL